ncbi:MAG TPA: hypothetical protein VEN79_06670 [Terriglobia bacterium]|nr:hypothetical protein [Terriglobia bacterium]
MKKTTLQSGNQSQRKLTWGRILWALLLAWNSARISFSQTHDRDVTLKIPPVRTTLKVENQPVTITASGTIAMTSWRQDRVAFRLELVADLSDFQQNITDILRSQLDKSDRCGEHIDIQRATLTPADPASVVTAELHYERWACAKIFGKQTARRLVGGNAVVELKLTPEVEESRTVRLQPELGTIQADGSLGELLRTGPFEQMLREKVARALQSATENGANFAETLPPAAQGFATILSARFKDAGSGHLAVVLSGEIHLTSQQADLLKNQLQVRASRAR